jgi:hypothetical protein
MVQNCIAKATKVLIRAVFNIYFSEEEMTPLMYYFMSFNKISHIPVAFDNICSINFICII